MQFASLDEWLAWQEQLHPHEIDMGLERVRAVWQRLSHENFTCPVITVAGTNGKGSSVALLTAIYRQSGYQVGSYTSPHLWRYNERIAINGESVTDEKICSAFTAIEHVRNEISLTYFEFGTLAALWIFRQQPLDVVILEVGLGGRLDAVNIIDADVALITPIDLDHQAWLGETREKIALEKAGILRADGLAVINDANPPSTLLAHAKSLGTTYYRYGHEYQWQRDGGQWRWLSTQSVRAGLPVPTLTGEHQFQNAAGVLMVVELLKDRLPVTQNQLREGLLTVKLAGRFQIEQGSPTVIYDVAHNPAAAKQLATVIQTYREQRNVHIVFSVLRDKELAGIVQPFCAIATSWSIAPLDVERAADIGYMHDVLRAQCPGAVIIDMPSIPEAIARAKSDADSNDIILVFGSFYTVAQATPKRL